MLVMGHRGAAGLAPENTLEALRVGFEAGVDILEFDVRLTKDKIPILSHDFTGFRLHRDPSLISQRTLADLKKRFRQPIVTLEEVLDEFFGKVVLNIELKGRGIGEVVPALIRDQYIKHSRDWDSFFLSSFWGKELVSARRTTNQVNLALIHFENPFLFIAYHKRLNLTAVGFHRLYVNDFALEIAKRAGIFTYVYTIDRPHTALLFARKGIDGIVTNRPDIILTEVNKSP